MDRLDLADAFVTLFALIGPQKLLLSVARIARDQDVRHVRVVMAYAALAAAFVGVTCTLAAPWLATFFHITAASVELAAGVVFFVYAICLVFGVHPGDVPDERAEDPSHNRLAETRPTATPSPTNPASTSSRSSHSEDGAASTTTSGDGTDPTVRPPWSDGFHGLLLPFIVSPLGVAAALEGSLAASNWGSRGVVAGAYTAVVAVDLIVTVAFAPLMRRIHASSLEVLSRLLGILLSAVAANLFLQGLSALGVHLSSGH